MRARLLTAAIGIPIFLGAALVGGVWWLLLIALITLLGLLEWHGLIRNAFEITLPLDALLGGGLLVLVTAYNGVEGSVSPGFGSGAVLFFVAVYTVVQRSAVYERRPLAVAGAVVLGVVYVAGLLSHLLLLRGLGPRDGLILTLLAIVGTWLTDTGAFFVGRWLGGRRLVPALSPNKTVSGAVGGWVTGFVGLLAASVFLSRYPAGASCFSGSSGARSGADGRLARIRDETGGRRERYRQFAPRSRRRAGSIRQLDASCADGILHLRLAVARTSHASFASSPL